MAKFNSSRLKPSGEYTATKGRKFAMTLGFAFAIIAAIAYWRGRELVPLVTGGIAAVWLLAAVVLPGRLGPVERAWMSIAHTISRVTTPIFMGIMYFGVLAPVGLLRRTFGRDPLTRIRTEGSYWVARRPMEKEKVRLKMERQF